MIYQQLSNVAGSARSDVILRADGAVIPADPANADWQAYQVWVKAGNTPNPAPGPSPGDLVAYATGTWQSYLAAGQIFNLAAANQQAVPVLCDGTNDTRADLALLALFGQGNPTGTKTWLDNTGKATILTGSQFVTLATLAGTWVSDTYATLAALVAAIEATPPTVTARAQIDATSWPTS